MTREEGNPLTPTPSQVRNGKAARCAGADNAGSATVQPVYNYVKSMQNLCNSRDTRKKLTLIMKTDELTSSIYLAYFESTWVQVMCYVQS